MRKSGIYLILMTFAFILPPLPTAASEIPNIAVYVTSGRVSDKITGEENRALATFILDALIKSGRFVAIERSDRFVEQLELEQVKQRSGAVDDNDIRRLGIQAGVQFVCIADITRVLDAYQISARIVDIETARVAAMGVSLSSMESAEELRRVSEEIVGKMLPALPPHRRNQIMREFSGSRGRDTIPAASQVKETAPEKPRPESESKSEKEKKYYSVYNSSAVVIQAGFGTAFNAEVTLRLNQWEQRIDLGLGYLNTENNEGVEVNFFYTLQTHGDYINLCGGFGTSLFMYYDKDLFFDDEYLNYDLGLGIQAGAETVLERVVLGAYARWMWYLDEKSQLTFGVSVGRLF